MWSSTKKCVGWVHYFFLFTLILNINQALNMTRISDKNIRRLEAKVNTSLENIKN